MSSVRQFLEKKLKLNEKKTQFISLETESSFKFAGRTIKSSEICHPFV